jgi:hypothetical protein
MAGDWIPFDHDLETKEEVVALAQTLLGEFGTAEAAIAIVLLRLKKLWCWGDRQTVDGVLRSCCADVALVCGGDAHFWEEVARVGWLEVYDGRVVIPNFAERFGASARRRMLACKRMRHIRKRNTSATQCEQNANKMRPQNQNQKTSSSNEEDVCSEPVPRAAEPPVLVYPCNGKPDTWGLTAAKLAEYRESFPKVDAAAECRKALQWCRDNRAKRKTARGMPAFLGRWLAKEQDRSRGESAPTISAAELCKGIDE